ncbi:MAG: DUF3253 domain-containing protein [Casimicrobiaceae bacterium]
MGRSLAMQSIGRIRKPSGSSGPIEAAIAATLLELCTRRALRHPGGTVCPSEVARALWPEGGGWRAHMDAVRVVGRALALEGAIEITQRGRVLDPGAPGRGPIRYRLPLR